MRVGAELTQEKGSSVTLTQEDFTNYLKLLLTSPELRAGRRDPSSMDSTKIRRCKFGELRSVAAVSRPDICSRLARIATRFNAPCGSCVHRVDELGRVVKEWQPATAQKYASSSRPWKTLGGSGRAKDDLCDKGGKVHGGSTSLS